MSEKGNPNANPAAARPAAPAAAPSKSPTHRKLVMTRVFDAPRALVFQAWTDPKHVAQWWGPHHFTTTVHAWDARPGGAIKLDMKGPDGAVYPMIGRFEEVVSPERVVLVGAVPDADGKPVFEVRHTMTFTETGGKTVTRIYDQIQARKAGSADPENWPDYEI